MEVITTVEPFEIGRGFPLRVLRTGEPRADVRLGAEEPSQHSESPCSPFLGMLVKVRCGKRDDKEVTGAGHGYIGQSPVLGVFSVNDGINDGVPELGASQNKHGVNVLALHLMDSLLSDWRKKRLSFKEGKFDLIVVEPGFFDFLPEIWGVIDAKLNYQLSKALAEMRNPFTST